MIMTTESKHLGFLLEIEYNICTFLHIYSKIHGFDKRGFGATNFPKILSDHEKEIHEASILTVCRGLKVLPQNGPVNHAFKDS